MSEPVRQSVAVLADDLIWASRLVAAAHNAGAAALRATTVEQLAAFLASGDVAAVIVDLNGRRYDGVAAVAQAAAGGQPTLAVGQHEDLDLRKRALDAGARRVYSYNKLFRDGPSVIGALLAEPAR